MIIHSNRKNFLYIFCKDISSHRNNWNPGFFSIFHLSDAVNEYNGIWACSSILHLPKKELRSVLQKKMCIRDRDLAAAEVDFAAAVVDLAAEEDFAAVDRKSVV